MIEKDYILVLTRQLAQMLAKILFLKKSGDKKEIKTVVYDGLRIAGLGTDPLDIDAEAIGKIEDVRVLAALSELLSAYLSDEKDESMAVVNRLITERLKEKNTLVLKL